MSCSLVLKGELEKTLTNTHQQQGRLLVLRRYGLIFQKLTNAVVLCDRNLLLDDVDTDLGGCIRIFQRCLLGLDTDRGHPSLCKNILFFSSSSCLPFSRCLFYYPTFTPIARFCERKSRCGQAYGPKVPGKKSYCLLQLCTVSDFLTRSRCNLCPIFAPMARFGQRKLC